MKYYTFEIDGQKVGYYEEEDVNGLFYCCARMIIDGQSYENPFWVHHERNTVLATKYGGDDWRTFDQPEGVYPGSAVHILLDVMGKAETWQYIAYNESDGTLAGIRTLLRIGNRIEEYATNQLQRYYVVQDGEIIEYGWGSSARSVLVCNRSEALTHTPFVEAL